MDKTEGDDDAFGDPDFGRHETLPSFTESTDNGTRRPHSYGPQERRNKSPRPPLSGPRGPERFERGDRRPPPPRSGRNPPVEPADQLPHPEPSTDAPSINLEALEVGKVLGSGGQAHVYALGNRPHVVFKRYNKESLPNASAMARIVNWPQTLSGADQNVVQTQMSWPGELVREGGATIGVLIPKAREAFYLEGGDGELRELQWLILAERARQLNQRTPDAHQRLLVLRSIALGLDVMHRNGVAHRDISWRNILWSEEPPYSYFLDCDGAIYGDVQAPLPYVQTMHWTDPRVEHDSDQHPDVDSDRYAFALAFYRSYFTTKGYNLTLGSVHSIQTAPYLTQEIKLLLIRSLDSAPRPAMGEWLVAIDDLLAGNLDLGEVEMADTALSSTPRRFVAGISDPKPRKPAPVIPPTAVRGNSRRGRKPASVGPTLTGASPTDQSFLERLGSAKVAIAVLSLVLLFLISMLITALVL